MRIVCDRPGCVGVATVAFAFDGESRVVLLHPPDTVGTAGRMCARHAARFQPPQGWTVFEPASVAEPAAVVEPIAQPVLAAVGARSEPPAAPAPAPREDDDFDKLLRADSPLLARAFRTAQ